MVATSKKSRKEEYISDANLQAKSRNWLSDIRYYSYGIDDWKYVPTSSALIVMDMQKFFLSEESHAFIPASKAIIPNVRDLIASFRNRDLPVIFTRHSLKKNEEPGIMGRWWADVIREDSELSNITNLLTPLDSEIVIRKTRYSAFFGTELEKVLKREKVENIVVTGVMTHLCCETTAREAFMKDFEVFFVVDATATQNEELHLSTLRTLSDGFAVPVTTKEILKEIEEGKT
ncbi:MAG: cysteine hydrolase [Thermoplasmata archaeon]|nr:MAG: cysteine hydrolase [Thermoplasmata archaeon]